MYFSLSPLPHPPLSLFLFLVSLSLLVYIFPLKYSYAFLLAPNLSIAISCDRFQITSIFCLFHQVFFMSVKQGDQMFLLKNCPKTMKNCPKSRPTMFLLDLLYKTVLWCFLFDFMLISNGTGDSFIVFCT